MRTDLLGRCQLPRRADLDLEVTGFGKAEEEGVHLGHVEFAQGMDRGAAIPGVQALVEGDRADGRQEARVRLLRVPESSGRGHQPLLPQPRVRGGFQNLGDPVGVLVFTEVPHRGERPGERPMPVLVVERGRPVQEVAGDEEHLVVQWPVRVVHSPPGVRLRLLVVAQRIAHDTEVATAQPLTELPEKRRLIAIRHRVSSMIGSSGWQTDLPHVLQFQGSLRPADQARRAPE
ncbi:hypothetical protein ACFQY7_40680 [Actinomadura luteofluorescens]|uniref:hypothetical protein n=1 Tax=Actinomadura luteofluorescens TaxID=46163 RepID=UPI00363C9801